MDPQSCCHSLGALAVQLYQQLIRTAEKRLKPMIGTVGAGGRWGMLVQRCEILVLLQGLCQRGKVDSELEVPPSAP